MVTYDLAPILARISFVPEHKPELNPIPWPEGLAPKPQDTRLNYDGTLPGCDVLVITWTAAEAMALADVLTPGVESTAWTHYDKDFQAYEKQLTGRSPAKEADRLGEFHQLTIGSTKVIAYHSQLHPATDGPSLPTAQMAAQIAKETGAKLVITTGTAGAANKGNVLGDITVGSAVHSWFTKRLAKHSWSEELWPTTTLSAGQQAKLADDVIGPLFAANCHKLPAAYAPRAPKVWGGHIVSTDWFCYGSDNDACGLTAYDGQVTQVEMDDAAVALGVLGTTESGTAPAFAAVRNSSDPMLPDGTPASLKLAEQIYQRWGYTTTIGSAIGCWALIAGFEQE